MKSASRGTLMVIGLFFACFMLFHPAWAEAPKRGGDYKAIYGMFPPHFNCAIQSGAAIQIPSAQIFVGLLEFDDKWQPVPYLAESWEVSDDGLAYTFHLVEGTVFHDGRPVTSEDVAFSIGVVKNNHPFGRSMYGPVASVETPDAKTVVIKLSQPQPSLMLCLVPVLTPILPKHIYGDGQPIRKHPANTAPVGSGPFKLVEFKPGESFILERFDKFLRPGRPYLDRYIGIKIKDPSAVEAALKNGDMHGGGFNSGLKLLNVVRLKKSKNLTLTEQGYEAIGPFAYIEMNLRNKPFDDVRVRKAIAYAIDMDFILEKLQRGMAKRATGPILPFSNPFYSPDVTLYNLDLDRADKLLDEAGYPKNDKGIRFSVTLDWLPGVYDDNQVIAEYLRPQLRKVGIDVNLRRPSGFGPWIKTMASWQFEMSMDIIFCYPDPIIGVHRLFHSKNIKHIPWSNIGGYQNPKVDELLDKASVETDVEKRKALYAEFQKIVTDEVPYIFIHQPAYHTISNKDLRGLPSGIWGNMGPNDGVYWKDGHPPK